MTDFESGFTITLDQNKKFIRDYKHQPSYYYLTFIFSQQNYYILKELSNNSLVLANSENIPLGLGNQGSIKDKFDIAAPIYGSFFKIWMYNSTYSFEAYFLSNDNKFYSLVLHNTSKHITKLEAKEVKRTGPHYRAQNIRGIVYMNAPYILINNSLIEINVIYNQSQSKVRHENTQNYLILLLQNSL